MKTHEDLAVGLGWPVTNSVVFFVVFVVFVVVIGWWLVFWKGRKEKKIKIKKKKTKNLEEKVIFPSN